MLVECLHINTKCYFKANSITKTCSIIDLKLMNVVNFNFKFIATLLFKIVNYDTIYYSLDPASGDEIWYR